MLKTVLLRMVEFTTFGKVHVHIEQEFQVEESEVEFFEDVAFSLVRHLMSIGVYELEDNSLVNVSVSLLGEGKSDEQ